MSGHEPKLRALIALDRRQLSAAGEARLRKHLVGCELCRHAQAGRRLAEHLIGEVAEAEPQVDFAKVQAGLARRGKADRRRRVVLASALLPLAAAAAGIFYLTRAAPQPVARPAPIPAPAPSQNAPSFPASITALAGPGMLQPAAGPLAPVQIDAALRDGDRLQLGPDSLAHVRLDRASGCVIGPGSEVVFTRLRRGETELALQSGRVTSKVQPLTAAERYLIRAAGYTISVRGTHFEVTLAGDKLDVMVSEGHVVVEDDHGATVADLRARDQFAIDRSFGARLATRDPSHPTLQLEIPRALGVTLDAWPRLTLLDVASLERFGVTALSLDGSRFPIQGELALRVPAGDVPLIVERLTVAPQNFVIHVPAEGLSISADALRQLLKLHNQADDPKAKDVDFQPVLAVIRAGTGGLQRCYERSLKQRPDLDGRLTIRVSIEPNGRVAQVLPRSQTATLPPDLVECMRNVSGQWRFPATGSPLAFDVPLRLSPR